MNLIFSRTKSAIDEMTQSFRAICLKLSTGDCILKPLSDNCSFKILTETEESTSLEMSGNLQFEVKLTYVSVISK